MKNILSFLFFLSIYSHFAQNQPPLEPLFNSKNNSEFYNFLNNELSFSKIVDEDYILLAFYLDNNGIMHDVVIKEYKNESSFIELQRVLLNANKWDVSNQKGNFSKIVFKYKLVFSNNSVKGEKKMMVYTNNNITPLDVNKSDFSININQTSLNDNLHDFAGVQKKPEFPGGMQEFYKFIGQNYKAPNVKGLKGKVFVTFIVEKDGTLTDIKVLRDIGYGTGEEAIRVLKLSPLWKPGEQQGIKVRVQYSLPISIQLKS